MSAAAMIECSDLPDRDAALSLCAMGRMTVDCDGWKSLKSDSRRISLCSADADLRQADVVPDDASGASSCSESTGRATESKLPLKKRPAKPEVKPRTESKLKYSKAVPYEEMKRLMRVYGPAKCLRNRTPKESGKATKAQSVRRKFYRWFPDFHDRFELRPGGWFMPKIGHEEEMRRREELRKRDQVVLAMKRYSKRRTAAGPNAMLLGGDPRV